MIDRLQKISHVEDCALLDAKSGNIVSANKALAIRVSSPSVEKNLKSCKEMHSSSIFLQEFCKILNLHLRFRPGYLTALGGCLRSKS